MGGSISEVAESCVVEHNNLVAKGDHTARHVTVHVASLQWLIFGITPPGHLGFLVAALATAANLARSAEIILVLLYQRWTSPYLSNCDSSISYCLPSGLSHRAENG